MRIELDTTKYVMATIHVPIEIGVDGEQTIHSELYHIEYSVIDQLPDFPQNRNTEQLSNIFSKIAETYDAEIEFKQTLEPNSTIIDDTSSDMLDSNSVVSDSDSESDSEFVFKPEYNDYIDDDNHIDNDPVYESDDEPKNTTTTIQFSHEIPDELIVRKDEIRKYRPFPKSKTFRRTHKPQSRFSRKSETRFLRVPDTILREFSEQNSNVN
jgi:hypothetical protein